MNQVIGRVSEPFEILEKLAVLGAISPEVAAELHFELKASRTGRYLGDPNSSALPKNLETVAQRCSMLCESDPQQIERCRKIFNIRLSTRFGRDARSLNSALGHILNEIEKPEDEGEAKAPATLASRIVRKVALMALTRSDSSR